MRYILMDLAMPSSRIKPYVGVLVTTVQSLRTQGEGNLEHGIPNLEKHISIIRGFGLHLVVAINRFPQDSDTDLETLREFCETRGASFALSEAFARGREGTVALARKVVESIEATPEPELTTTYATPDSITEKISEVALQIFGAEDAELTRTAKDNLARLERWGFGHLPACIAKTQYSLADDPRQRGAPTGRTLHVTDISLSAEAGFPVIPCGATMLMPGLPNASQAINIDVDATGEITGMS